MNNRHAVVTYKVSLPFLSCVGLRNETGDKNKIFYSNGIRLDKNKH